jgi:hypothetical protein
MWQFNWGMFGAMLAALFIAAVAKFVGELVIESLKENH